MAIAQKLADAEERLLRLAYTEHDLQQQKGQQAGQHRSDDADDAPQQSHNPVFSANVRNHNPPPETHGCWAHSTGPVCRHQLRLDHLSLRKARVLHGAEKAEFAADF
jgi:hypothetical protein